MLLVIYLICIVILVVIAFYCYFLFMKNRLDAKVNWNVYNTIQKTNQSNKSAYTLDQIQQGNSEEDKRIINKYQKQEKKHVVNMEKKLTDLEYTQSEDFKKIAQSIPKNPKDFNYDLQDMSSEIDLISSQVNNLETIVAASPLEQQVLEIMSLKNQVNDIGDLNKRNKENLKDFIDVIVDHSKHVHDSIKGIKRSEYVFPEEFNDFKQHVEGMFVHRNDPRLHRLLDEPTLHAKYQEKSTIDINPSPDYDKNYIRKATLSSKYVEKNDARQDYMAKSSLENLTKPNDLMNLVKINDAETQKRASIEAMMHQEEIMKHATEGYGTKNDVKNLERLVKMLEKEVVTVTQKCTSIVDNYVTKATFDTFSRKNGTSQDTLDGIKQKLLILSTTVDQAKDKYIKKADAMQTYTLLTITQNLITKMKNLSFDTSILNAFKTFLNKLYVLPNSIADLQQQINKFGNLSIYAPKQDLKDLESLYIKRLKEKKDAEEAYRKAHEHDPYTQSGEVSFVLDVYYSLFTPALQANGISDNTGIWDTQWVQKWPAFVPLSYWGTTWYRINYNKPFYKNPTFVGVQCISNPSLSNKLEIVHTDNPIGFLLVVKFTGSDFGIPDNDLFSTSRGRGAIAAKQTFGWIAKGQK